ncbi:MAG: hypothetical protein AAFU67_01415, partial [Bacteroidota bacterium]
AYQRISSDEQAVFCLADRLHVHCLSPSSCEQIEPEEGNVPDDQEEPVDPPLELAAAAVANPIVGLYDASTHAGAGSGKILSGFRLLKDEQPVAVHGKYYQTSEERDEVKAAILEAAVCGELGYCGLVEQTSQVLHTEGFSHSYRWRMALEGPEKPLLWRSTRFYSSEDEAMTAFQEEMPTSMALAEKQNNYEVLHLADHLRQLNNTCWPSGVGSFQDYNVEELDDTPYLVLLRDGFPVLYAPNVDATDNTALGPARRSRMAFAKQYPFRLTDNGWSYKVVDPENGAEWLGNTDCYASLTEARKAYQALLALLAYAPNYRCTDKGPAGIYRFHIVETLLTSTLIYADDLPAETDPAGGADPNLGPTVICPAEYHNDMYTVGERQFPVATDCPPPCTPEDPEPLCPRAWSEGLENFLIYAIQEDNYYEFIDPERGCDYGFRIVDDQYRLARNPRETHTPAERERLLDWLYQYVNCGHKTYLLEPYNDVEVITLVGRSHLQFAYDGEVHWRSSQGFMNAEAARSYWNENDRERLTQWMGYAQELDFYLQQRQLVTDPDNPQYRLILVDESGVEVLESPETYPPEELEAEILKRIQHARLYPFYLFDRRYGFQCFSAVDLPDLSQPIESPCLNNTENTIQANSDGQVLPSIGGSKCPSSASLGLNLAIPGEVIWESYREYDNKALAKCEFDCFVELLRNRYNYQRTQLDDCNLFGLELTHPDRVLAEHPMRYEGRTLLRAAVDRTRHCINQEGLHLIEHLLLRPRNEADATIPDICPDPEPIGQALAAKDCDFTVWPSAEESTSAQPGGTYVPGADPYSFWATVVLPYWPSRFQNSNFRAFFESTLRREAPAHVALRICWLDPKQMRDFERHYRQWLATLAEQDNCNRMDIQAKLIETLFSLTTVYPPARLQGDGCSPSSTDAGAILLNSTQLS